jgi:hypothetical protein
MVKFHDALIVSVSNFHNVITILNSCCVFVFVLDDTFHAENPMLLFTCKNQG